MTSDAPRETSILKLGFLNGHKIQVNIIQSNQQFLTSYKNCHAIKKVHSYIYPTTDEAILHNTETS